MSEKQVKQESVKKVVGVAYEPGEGLPRIVLKGHGAIADEIVKSRPLGSGPALIKNKQLVDQLYRLPVDADISEDTFQMVATILSHVFSVEEKLRNRNE